MKMLARCLLVVLTAMLRAMPVAAQPYPSKPITLVVPFAAGGPTDVVARTLSAAMTKSLNQTVVVENKTGAGGTIAAAYVARAAADGYTFLIHHNGMATAPALYRKLNYNPLTDFEYVSQVIDVPMTLLGRKDLPAKDFKELLAMNALLGSQVDLLCDQTTSTTQHIKAGSVKLYGVTTLSRLKTLPDAPTLAEQGLKGFEVVVWHGIYAPKGTPKEAIEKFGAALRAALKDPAVTQQMNELGAVIVPEAKQTPAGLQAWLAQETTRYAPVIKAAGQFAD